MSFQVDKLDLELAWRRAKNDVHTGRVFMHTPFEELLVEASKEEWLQRLSDSIAAGYRPRSALKPTSRKVTEPFDPLLFFVSKTGSSTLPPWALFYRP